MEKHWDLFANDRCSRIRKRAPRRPAEGARLVSKLSFAELGELQLCVKFSAQVPFLGLCIVKRCC